MDDRLLRIAITILLLLFFVSPVMAQEHNIYFPIILSPELSTKKGIGLTGGIDCGDVDMLRCSWFYNWGQLTNCKGEFIPMLRTSESMEEPYYSVAIEQANKRGFLLGFNESNVLNSQWNFYISPRNAAIYWRQIEKDVNWDVVLVSPSTSPHYPGEIDPYGYLWLSEMVRQYEFLYGRKPRFDAIAVHSYFPTAAESKRYITTVKDEMKSIGYNVPLWITEYGGESHTGIGNMEIMTKLTLWFEQTEWIHRYVWFSNRLEAYPRWTNFQLVNSDDSLTELGVIYSGF